MRIRTILALAPTLAVVALFTTGCPKDRCGNGEIDDGEQCDDGNSVPGDGCSAACLLELGECGNNVVEAGEECDDGNTANNDGCSGICLFEAVCGNGTIEGGEECDDGNTATGDGCDDGCQLETTCGDGVVEGVEECDDGNTTDGDGCSSICVIEVMPVCGDGTVDPGEDCDDGVNNSDTAPNTCRTDCTNPACGDSVIDDASGEACDDGNTATGDGCDDVCQLETTCGDSLVEGVEQCDDGAANSDTMANACRTNCVLPFCGDNVTDDLSGETCDDGNVIAGDGCDALCTIEPACGNGIIEPGETCDDGNTTAGDGCDATCQSEAVCGDGVVGAGEQCDDGNTNNGDGCDASCQFENTCGDGNVEPGETCDDGNTTAGDGCDATCQLESNTVCSTAVDLNDPANTTSLFDFLLYAGDTTGAPDDFIATCANGGGTGDEVHVYTLTSAARLLAQTLPTGPGGIGDTVVWVLDDCLGLGEAACDEPEGPGQLSRALTGIYPAGTNFYVVVDGDGGGNEGTYNLALTEVYEGMGGDDCAGAPTLFEGSYYDDSATGSDNFDSTCGGAGANDRVYAIDSPGGVDLLVFAANVPPTGFYDITVSARTMCGSPASEVNCVNAQGANDAYEGLDVLDTTAQTYYIIVDGIGGDDGDFVLHAYFRDILPAGAMCDNADTTARCETGTFCSDAGMGGTCDAPTTTGDCTMPNVITAGSYIGDTTGGTSVEDTTCAIMAGAPEIVYEYVMPGDGDLVASVTDLPPGWDGLVEIRTGACDTAGTTVLDCGDTGGPGTTETAVASDLLMGETVWIVVEGWTAAAEGPFQLDVTYVSIIPQGMACDPADPTLRCETGTTCFDGGTGAVCSAPVTSDCSAPTVVAAGSHLGDTTGLPATWNSTCGGFSSEVVFEYTVAGPNPEDLTLTMTPLTGGITTPVVSLTTMACGGMELGCDTGPGGSAATLTVADVAPGTYYITADAFTGGEGPFVLDIVAVEVIPMGGTCIPGDPGQRCETGTGCSTTTMMCDVPGVVFEETFDTAIPVTWTVVDFMMDAWTWTWCAGGGMPCGMLTMDFGSLTNNTGSASDGGYAIVDSDDSGFGLQLVEELWAPSVDLSTYGLVLLEFDTDYVNLNDTATIEVSTDSGMSWTVVDTWTFNVGPARVSYDISAIAAGQADVIVRFTYDANFDWNWQIDDFTILGL